MDFEWHDGKDELLRLGRGFGFADVLPIFAGRTVERPDSRRDYGEVRTIAIGRHGSDFYTVIYTMRGEVRWPVTAWRSNRRERARWLA